MKKLSVIPFVLLFSISISAMADATDESDRIDKIVDSVISEKRQIIKESIQLTAAEEKRFWPLYDEFQSAMGEVLKKTAILMDKFIDENETLSNEQADAIIDEIMNIQIAFMEVQKSYAKKFRKILPPKKVLMFVNAIYSLE